MSDLYLVRHRRTGTENLVRIPREFVRRYNQGILYARSPDIHEAFDRLRDYLAELLHCASSSIGYKKIIEGPSSRHFFEFVSLAPESFVEIVTLYTKWNKLFEVRIDLQQLPLTFTSS